MEGLLFSEHGQGRRTRATYTFEALSDDSCHHSVGLTSIIGGDVFQYTMVVSSGVCASKPMRCGIVMGS